MRIEREASCDAASIAATGQRLKYAEVLVGWTAQLRQSALGAGVTGFADPENHGTLVDRIKRITLAGHRPRLNISWPIAGVTIGLSLLCLAALWQGTAGRCRSACPGRVHLARRHPRGRFQGACTYTRGS